MTAIPRIVVSAPSSGHGKTAVAIGLLAAFAARGLRAAGFKVGPDHIDAAYLGLAAGRHGRNLDPQLVGAHRVAPLFAHGAAGADIAVIEGTMGLYDGLAGRTDVVSTAGVAGQLRAPVVFVVDVAAMGQSVAALVHGFRAYDEVVWLGGVILNRVASDRHEQLLREALDDIGVPVLGALRRRALAPAGPAALPPRALGPVPVVHQALEATRATRRLGEEILATVDLDRILALGRSAPQLSVDPWSASDELADAVEGGRPVVAVAGGPVHSYGYAETAELLTTAGADVVAVDPLRDEGLPDGTAALVVGGGLPEAFADELSANVRLSAAVASLARAGRPVVAEGTGLVWLCRELDGRPMCGVLDATARSTEQLVIGYRQATVQTASPVFGAGTEIVGYKYHRTQVSPRAGTTDGAGAAWAWPGGQPEGFVWRGVHASYLTLHWAGAPEIARRVVAAATAAGSETAGSKAAVDGQPAAVDSPQVAADGPPAAVGGQPVAAAPPAAELAS